MTLYKHELRQGRLMLCLWTIAIAGMVGLCVLIYPEMGAQMKDFSRIFAMLGSFSAAFGLDKINFGEFIGFFGIECGNILGIGGALYAAMTGAASLASEENGHTAEFLLTHPVSRAHVVAQKLLAVLTQVVMMNAAVALATLACVLLIGVTVSAGDMALLLFAHLLMQLIVACIAFCMGAFMRRGYLGAGLGFAVLAYFINIAANLSKGLRFLKYLTPFGFTDSADLISTHAMNGVSLTVSLVAAAACVAVAFIHYGRKDIA